MSPLARNVSLVSLLVAAVVACDSGTDAPPSTPMGGSSPGGSASSAGSGGSSGLAGGANGGSANGGSAVAGSANGGSASGGGSAGTAGAGAGSGGGSAGTAGSGGGGFWGPNGPKKAYTCPAGPFPEQELGEPVAVCDGFDFEYNFVEGPTWIASEGAFFFSNFPIGQYTGGNIVKFTPGGACEVWLEDVGCNGLGVSPSGNLLGACQGPRAVMEYDVKTKQGRMVASMADGKQLDSPNDLIARGDGNVYFSNRTAELGNRPKGLGEGLVRIDPMGVTSVIQLGGLNGVALSPDDSKLHVVTMGTWALDAAGVPGQKGGPTPSGDGIAVDCAGTISREGTNSAFGGTDQKTLFIVGPNTETHTRSATVPGLP